VINELEVSGTHIEAHHIDHLGGLYNGRSWRLAKMDVIRYIQSGVRFVSKGADGTRALVEVLQHAKTRNKPDGPLFSTVPDRSKANNLSGCRRSDAAIFYPNQPSNDTALTSALRRCPAGREDAGAAGDPALGGGLISDRLKWPGQPTKPRWTLSSRPGSRPSHDGLCLLVWEADQAT